MTGTGGKATEREQLARDVLRHLLGVVQAIKTHMTDLAASFDLTPSQLGALRHLDEARSQRELAGCLHFDASNITDIVDRLEERGLVVRTVDTQDRRVRRVVLTAEGAELRDKLFEQAIATAPLAALEAEEQRTLCDLLGRIAEPEDLLF